MASKKSIKESVTKYERFVDDVLKEELRKIERQLKLINAEVADLIHQRHSLKVILDKELHPSGFKAQVNLGCNFFVEAAVADTSSMLVNIGLNHYLEFTPAETKTYLDTRIHYFEEISCELQKKATDVKAHIKLIILCIIQLHEQEKKLGNAS